MQSAGLPSAMENVLNRYRNTTILVAVLFAQIVGLAVQVKRPAEAGSMTLIRYWAVSAITPLERGVIGAGHSLRNVWSNYLYLRGVREQNRNLKEQIDRMRIEEVRLKQDADQARRLQALLAFKEQFISHTIAAQVIGSSGSDLSRVIYIDKGSGDGIQPDMAVITPDGIVGKILRVFPHSSQVLEISDASSGVGAILEKSRLQGILNGSGSGDVSLKYVMSDEKVEPGEHVLTSGGDRIFPKGLPIGTVTGVNPGRDLFLNIRVKPTAELSRLEEVLVITKLVEKEPETQEPVGPTRAADILAQRLPTVEKKPPTSTPTPGAPAQPSTTAAKPATAGVSVTPKPTLNAASTTSASTTNAVSAPPKAATTIAPSAQPRASAPATTTAAAQRGSTSAGATTTKPAATPALPRPAPTSLPNQTSPPLSSAANPATSGTKPSATAKPKPQTVPPAKSAVESNKSAPKPTPTPAPSQSSPAATPAQPQAEGTPR